MNLPAEGREYVSWPYASTVTVTSADVRFDNEGSWFPLTITSATVLNALVAGPLATSNPGGTIVLGYGTHSAQIRFNDTPEIVIRSAGIIAISP